MRTVEDDALHIESPETPGATLCGQRIDGATNLGTFEQLRASGGADCWTCVDQFLRPKPEGPGELA